MSDPIQRLDEAVTRLREDQARIGEAGDRMAAVSVTVTSADRTVVATVDGQGRLTGLKLPGTRHQKMAPAELCSKIVETVRRAQDDATKQSLAAFTEFLPTGLGSMLNGSLDLDAMMNAALETAARPLFPDDHLMPKGRDGRG